MDIDGSLLGNRTKMPVTELELRHHSIMDDIINLECIDTPSEGEQQWTQVKRRSNFRRKKPESLLLNSGKDRENGDQAKGTHSMRVGELEMVKGALWW